MLHHIVSSIDSLSIYRFLCIILWWLALPREKISKFTLFLFSLIFFCVHWVVTVHSSPRFPDYFFVVVIYVLLSLDIFCIFFPVLLEHAQLRAACLSFTGFQPTSLYFLLHIRLGWNWIECWSCCAENVLLQWSQRWCINVRTIKPVVVVVYWKEKTGQRDKK